MDLTRFLQARRLTLFWVAVAIASTAAVSAAVLGPHYVQQPRSATVQLACDNDQWDVDDTDVPFDHTVFEPCKESPDRWIPAF